jgi:type VI secretion system protein
MLVMQVCLLLRLAWKRVAYFAERDLHWRRGLLGRLALGQRALDEISSLTANLHGLLNTRLGEALAAPDYGIVEFVDIVHRFPAATHVLRHAIQSVIHQYEPRLHGVQVNPLEETDEFCPAYEIVGTVVVGDVRHGMVRFHVVLTALGRLTVERGW